MAFNEGCKVKDIAEKFGVSISKVRAVTKKETHEDKQKKYKRMREYKAEGHTMQEVADEFGVAQATAQYVCKGIAPQKPTPPKGKGSGILKDIDKVKADIERRQPGFLFAGNYTGADDTVDLKCKECGSVATRSMITVRHNNIKCRECERIAKEKQEANKSVLEWFNGIVADIHKEEKQIKAQEKEEARWHPCVVCGKLTTRRKFCSNECYKTTTNYIQGSRDRLNKTNIIDADITLKRLFKKEWGVCYLCGDSCDWNDYTITESGVFIAGNTYPSIDHLVPLSKGGLHSWDNVRLAHRICNSKKSARLDVV